MKDLFHLALEGDRSEREIVVTGPMGQAFTKALNIAYAKLDPVTGEEMLDGGRLEGSAMESQAQEVSVMQQLIAAVNQDPTPDLDEGVQIYAVDPEDVTPETVSDVVTDLQDNPKEFVLIADDSAPGATDGSGETPIKSIEVTNDEPTLSLENGDPVPEEADDADLKAFFGQFEELATEALKSGFTADFTVQRTARARHASRQLCGTLRATVTKLGGKVFPSMEAYIDHLRAKRI